MNIKHNPVFDTEKVVEHYSKKDGVPVQYVCTTELDEAQNVPVDVFYRETPHPEFGNRYFGLFRGTMTDGILITNADSVENLLFPCVEDSDSNLHYSRYRHDYVLVDSGNVIDGGRAYTRCNHCPIYHCIVRDGEMIQKSKDDGEVYYR